MTRHVNTRGLQLLLFALMLSATAQSPVQAQDLLPGPDALITEQRHAMKKFAQMDGVWRGPAWTLMSGRKHHITQTERIGPFLDGSVKVIEGRGYNEEGHVTFNALGIISYDTEKKVYTMHSHAQGRVGAFMIKPTVDGYVWEIPAGRATIRYTAVIKDGTLHEVGDRIVAGEDPIRFFEMTLKRLGDSTWPAAGAVPMK